ncbi:MAG TPA: hypothetical protein VM536_15470 [Chloroflexia bacterium]|nr:hypothetical protein [Chloroflexia bacterium]
MGEFEGDDAGSPVLAKLQLHTTELTQYQPATHAAEPFNDSMPLETVVERRPIALTLRHPDEEIALDIRLLRLWINAAGRGLDDAWNRWSMFMLNTRGNAGEAVDTGLRLLPTVPKIQEGWPTETTVLIRDEMANMVWGIEKLVPLANGDSKPGADAARETLSAYQALLAVTPPPPAPEPKAPIRYQVMNSVPEHWIPFIPVRMTDASDPRQIQLQRAAMPPTLPGDPRSKVRPRTILLREGIDRAVRAAYFLHEEEVPRAGLQVSQAFHRTRWAQGRVFVWLGVHKQTARGEGSSGLAFDQIIDVRPKPA